MPKINYQKKLEETLQTLKGRRPVLLLHACCAPCSSYVLEYLSGLFDIRLFYYNPNIAPAEEYERRLCEVHRLVDDMGLQDAVAVTDGAYEPEKFETLAAGLEDEPEGGARCARCFRLRLSAAAKEAKRIGAEFFTTTLSISPHKDAALLCAVGEEMGRKYDIRYLYSDFKKRDGYRRSIELSRQYGLYRQDYCGCVYSKRLRGTNAGERTDGLQRGASDMIGEIDRYSYRCGAIDCFCEMVRAGLKRLALAHPCDTAKERDAFLPFCEEICRQYGILYAAEDEPLLTDLFPLSMNRGKHNILFYREADTMANYQALKREKRALIAAGSYDGDARKQIALRFGALLGYPASDCDRLIAQNEEKE